MRPASTVPPSHRKNDVLRISPLCKQVRRRRRRAFGRRRNPGCSSGTFTDNPGGYPGRSSGRFLRRLPKAIRRHQRTRLHRGESRRTLFFRCEGGAVDDGRMGSARRPLATAAASAHGEHANGQVHWEDCRPFWAATVRRCQAGKGGWGRGSAEETGRG